jgi:hypothetical protein
MRFPENAWPIRKIPIRHFESIPDGFLSRTNHKDRSEGSSMKDSSLYKKFFTFFPVDFF